MGIGEQAGRYVYCVALAGERVDFTEIGIAGSRVYTVAHKDLCAVVHECPAQPYQSNEANVLTSWVMAHHQVVDAAWRRWGAVLPLTFNTIINSEKDGAEDNLKAWLEMEYTALKGKLERLAGKTEYGVQVFWDTAVVASHIAENSPEIKKLKEEIGSRSPGIAYMYRQKLESLLRKEIELRAAEEFRDLYGRLKRCVDAIQVEKTRKAEEGRQMLINLSCLISSARLSEVKAELDRVSAREGFSVHLAGPFPPYSFC